MGEGRSVLSNPRCGKTDFNIFHTFTHHCSLFLDKKRSDHQGVQWRREEGGDRITWRADDRLPPYIEGRVDQHGNAGPPLKRPQQVVIEWMLCAINCLDACSAIYMAYGRNTTCLLAPHIEHEQHERRH